MSFRISNDSNLNLKQTCPLVSVCYTRVIRGSTFGFCTLVPSAGSLCSLQTEAEALQAEQDPEAHCSWQDWPSMEPTSHSALMVAALSWSKFSSSPEKKNHKDKTYYRFNEKSIASDETILNVLFVLLVLLFSFALIAWLFWKLMMMMMRSETPDRGFLDSWWSSRWRCPHLRLKERSFSFGPSDRPQTRAAVLVSSANSGNGKRRKTSETHSPNVDMTHSWHLKKEAEMF